MSAPRTAFVNPKDFGRAPLPLLRSAVSLTDQAFLDASVHQHEQVLKIQAALSTAGKKLPELAVLTQQGADQLRRKFNGFAPASLSDLKVWELGVASMTSLTPLFPTAQSKVVLPASPEKIGSWTDRVFTGDCLELMSGMPESSVDLILADLPYGTTKNKWDSIIPLPELWAQYERVIAPDGVIVLTAAQPFTAALLMSRPELFRHEWIWSKTIGSGQLNIKTQPLRTHESVLVFAPSRPKYFPQMVQGTPYKISRKSKNWTGRGYNQQTDHASVNTGTRFPKSVLPVANPRIKNGHPTQKPLALFEYLIRTYTEEGAIILDNVIGSGTTGEAALRTNRHFIGMDMDPEFVQYSQKRIQLVADELNITLPS